MNIKEQKGVTLFVLVITVVIMLLLAGTVAISISGYDDIKNIRNLANDLQNLREKVDIYYEKVGELPVSNIINDDIVTLLVNSKTISDGESYYKINLELLENISLTYGLEKFENDYFIVNEQSHNVYYYAGLKANNKIYYGIKDIPQVIQQVEFGVQSFEIKTKTNATNEDGILDIQLEVYADTVIDNELQYKFKLNDQEWTPNQVENSYTFHNLNQYETYTVSMIIIDNANNEIYASNNEMKVTIRKLPISLTIDGKTTGTYNNPLIPAGFVAVNENNAIWQSSDGYKNGLVITDDVDDSGKSTGNEFVWVPVDGTVVTFERKTWYKADGTTVLGKTTEETTETLPQALVNSVTNNGGFYIARYEAGIATDMPQTELISDSTSIYGNGSYKPVSKRNAIVWNYIQWGTSNNVSSPGNGAVTVANGMYPSTDTNYGVISTLVYGTQWDTILKFISEYNVGETGYNTYAINSTGMGNYSSGDTITSNSIPANTASLEVFRQKNIYDMGGNLWEWNMEKSGSSCITRSGFYNSDPIEHPASYRDINTSNRNTNGIGFRVALYLK